ncbi:hypothetical protein TRAPUB_9790 [Trametes pubescens]|uniref:Uncharacterized protein n=1 Tax=Trametes pubescens TaxID=154538 RepID=A0A1M2W1G2_TRAPU|nr:hypothetical protein TRAPUB_9790 [Trametes pubescens]
MRCLGRDEDQAGIGRWGVTMIGGKSKGVFGRAAMGTRECAMASIRDELMAPRSATESGFCEGPLGSQHVVITPA